ncbi:MULTISPECIES: nicotinate-nucleotide adenylyltransferase [unclassified Methylophaga]|uniref:nicotinate-nucleotide adenylyltransferase n=1 Tax=unclassified Methylophaga TaxID=2629249 RepID=UPI000C9428ED|nr:MULTISPECIES: nicotinate-nucleotide adenylyltransferase [unclassified Methylophaga]MBN47595.1 nicotinate-nicotinamide nucleotide adenylyltransferase [Methylophaga sp.]
MVKSENKSDAIGILGGTFDPVHFGHLRSALEVCQQLSLNHVRLIPCAVPPHRQATMASAEVRRLMLELAVKSVEQLIVDDRELQRDGPSFTVDTLLSLREELPHTPLFLILGTDAFHGLASWSRWQQILPLAHIVVVQRPEETLDLPGELQNCYVRNLAQAADRQLLAGKIWPLTVTPLAISATQIREDLVAGHPVNFLLPESVIAVIEQLGLYRSNVSIN